MHVVSFVALMRSVAAFALVPVAFVLGPPVAAQMRASDPHARDQLAAEQPAAEELALEGLAPEDPAPEDYRARMDRNADGRVSLSEYQDWLSDAFDAMDRDRDGVLTADELPGGKGRPITRIQYRQRLAETFHRQDGNRNGWLSAQDLAAPPR